MVTDEVYVSSIQKVIYIISKCLLLEEQLETPKVRCTWKELLIVNQNFFYFFFGARVIRFSDEFVSIVETRTKMLNRKKDGQQAYGAES